VSMIEVQSTLPIYEIDEKDTTGPVSDHALIARHHWNKRQFVVLEIGDHTYAVLATDLMAAIENAQNANR